MISDYLENIQRRRLWLLWLLMLAGMSFLLMALWRIQVGLGAHYEGSLERQSVRRVRIPGMRGRILDRNGLRLADNSPSYGIAIYLEELRQGAVRRSTVELALEMVERIVELTGLAPRVGREEIERHLRQRRALPLLAWDNIGQRELARLAEAAGDLPAVGIVVDARRVYPQGRAAGHLLGYVGKLEVVEEEEPYHYYLPDMVGRAGLERRFDDFLAGRPGGKLVRVDVAGFKYEELSARPAAVGGDLLLTLDLHIQQAAERALSGVVGAAVVLDVTNGDVLAVASAPEIDPNWFSPVLPRAVWDRLMQDPDKPLINRALSGVYPPGSIFKPVVSLAALEKGVITPDTRINCQGVFNLGRQTFSCYRSTVHGDIALRRALEVSCNVFFYKIGLACGVDAIHDMAWSLGLGRRTGLVADSEATGLLPGPEWKRRVLGEGWWDGDTCNLSIGQGALQVTPLQMAIVAAALANGGFVYRPRLVAGFRRPTEGLREEPAVLVQKVNWAPENIAAVQAGMRDAVQAPAGTGRQARVPGVSVAAKTGTAEFGPKSASRKHGWMIAFAPAERPRYALAMVVDEIDTAGGQEVGPRMRRLLYSIFGLPEGAL